MARKGNTYRNAALVGAAVGIGVGLVGINRKVPRLGTAWGVTASALAGLVLGAVAGGARSGSDFKKALTEGKS